MFKHAEDTTLLVPEHTDIGTDIEFNHVKAWAPINGLILTLIKTKEIVFRRPRAQSFHLPPVIDNIEQLNCSKLLGVLFQPNLKMDSYVQYILSQCSQCMYLIKLMQHKDGMPQRQLSVVTYSIIVSCIL